MANISVHNLDKNYDANGISIPALRRISLSVERGEFIAIAGPSGSGKTTLLNVIGGLDNPSSGKVDVVGRDLTAMAPRELSDLRLNSIGFIFQAYNLIPVLTSLENVEYILLQGVEKEERRARSRKILEEVGLKSEIDRRPRELSGGQQQRVAVARAIVSEPELVLADGPTANRGQTTGANRHDRMHDHNRDKNITFVFSTHDRMVMERAERLVSLSDGAVASDVSKRGGKRKQVPARGGAGRRKK